MRILHLISTGGYFGAENMLVNLCTGLRDLGVPCVIGVFESNNNSHLAVAERARKNSLPVILIPCRGRVDRKAVKTLQSHLLSQEFDILHSHGYKSSFYGWFATRRLNVSLVATCHNWTRATTSLRIYAFLELLILKRFQRVVGVSPEVVKILERAGISPERLRMIPNGVDIGKNGVETHPKDNNDLVVGTVGRLVEAKGFQNLLRAGPVIFREFPFVKFLIVGEGPFRSSLEKLSESLGIQSHVTFTGEQSEMARMYSSMDIFVLPSLNEGMPMTILEAMAAGKPVIASSVGGIPLLVRSGETGLLVEPGRVDSLQDALARLIKDPGLRTTLSDGGKALVRRTYSIQSMAHKYAELYGTLLQH